MKANKVPEKIYVQLPSSKWIGKQWDEIPIKEGMNPNWRNATNIEYTRTDAFIEKAEEYIYKQLNEGCIECGDIEKFIGEMKNYMKGE